MTPEQRTLAIERLNQWHREGHTPAELMDELKCGFLFSLGEAKEMAVISPEDAVDLLREVCPDYVPRVKGKAHTVHLKPKGEERWYVVASDPDYAVSNRLRCARLTATKRSAAGSLLSPQLRFFKGQFHAFYRLTRNGKRVDCNVGHLLANATKAGNKWR